MRADAEVLSLLFRDVDEQRDRGFQDCTQAEFIPLSQANVFP